MRSRLLLPAAVLAGLAGCGGSTASKPAASTAAAAGGGSTVRFTRALGGAVVPGPIFAADGSLLAATNAGTLSSLDPATGKERWRFDGHGQYGSDLSTSPLQLPDGTILWPGPNDKLYALSAAGKLRWTLPLGATGLTPARAPNGTVYVEDMGGTIHAIGASAAAGHERWRLRVGDGVSYGSAAVGADGTVYTTVGKQLVAVRDGGGAGNVRWRFSAAADIEVSPVVATGGTVVLGTNDAYEYGIDPDGRQGWRWKREVFTYSSPVATPDGNVSFGDHRGRLVTLNAKSGAVVRIDQGHGQVWGAPAIRNGVSVFTGHGGEVFGFDAAGKRVLHATLGGAIDATPAIGPDGTVYVGSEDGKLTALRAPTT